MKLGTLLLSNLQCGGGRGTKLSICNSTVGWHYSRAAKLSTTPKPTIISRRKQWRNTTIQGPFTLLGWGRLIQDDNLFY